MLMTSLEYKKVDAVGRGEEDGEEEKVETEEGGGRGAAGMVE